MTNEELKALGFTDEQIAKVFELHGKVVNPLKDTITQKEGELSALELANKQLKETQTTVTEKLKSFEGIDVDGLKSEITTLQGAIKDAETKHNSEMESLKKKNIVTQELAKMSVCDPRDFDHLLNFDLISVNDSGVMGLKDQLEKIKLEKSYLFKSTNKQVGGEKPEGSDGDVPPVGAKEGTLAWFEEQERLKNNN